MSLGVQSYSIVFGADLSTTTAAVLESGTIYGIPEIEGLISDRRTQMPSLLGGSLGRQFRPTWWAVSFHHSPRATNSFGDEAVARRRNWAKRPFKGYFPSEASQEHRPLRSIAFPHRRAAVSPTSTSSNGISIMSHSPNTHGHSHGHGHGHGAHGGTVVEHVIHLPKKRTIIKDRVGCVRTSTYDLPGGDDYTYGHKNERGVEGAGDSTSLR